MKITKDNDGNLIYLDDNNHFHSTKFPAKIDIDYIYGFNEHNTVEVESKKWYYHGNLHRFGAKPAIYSYYQNELIYTSYYKNGDKHRFNAPSMVWLKRKRRAFYNYGAKISEIYD